MNVCALSEEPARSQRGASEEPARSQRRTEYWKSGPASNFGISEMDLRETLRGMLLRTRLALDLLHISGGLGFLVLGSAETNSGICCNFWVFLGLSWVSSGSLLRLFWALHASFGVSSGALLGPPGALLGPKRGFLQFYRNPVEQPNNSVQVVGSRS